MKNPKANFEDFQSEKLVATQLKVVRGGDGESPVDPGKNNGGNGNT
ncbi:rSAM-modified peptide [Flavobacterium sp. YJ01]|nr:rSAM-modified peptide [Flavobacterium sp. YJ01]WET04919.1 rSAM-modified peptide [Flavobacterium sp. YJ01]